MSHVKPVKMTPSERLTYAAVMYAKCTHNECVFCAREFFSNWLPTRMGQMNTPQTKRGETTSFSEAAATSIRPPR